MLKPVYRIVETSQSLTLEGETKKFVLQNLSNSEKQLVKSLVHGIRTESFHRKSLEPEGSLLEALFSKDLLTQGPLDVEQSIESKQRGFLANYCFNPADAQKRINIAKVAIFGLGGTGLGVLEHLVGAGVTNFSLIDGDSVQIDNLNRQYAFNLQNVGEHKVEAAARYIISKRPDSAVHTTSCYVKTKATAIDILRRDRPDFTVICVDSPIGLGSRLIARACWDEGIPSIFGGVGLERGFYGPVHCVKKSPTGPSHKTKPANPDVPLAGTPYSFGPTNSMVASLIAAQTIFHLAGIHSKVEYKSTRNINFHTGSVVEASGPYR